MPELLDIASNRMRTIAEPEANHPGCYGNAAGWAVVHTHPQAERWADQNLRRQGYETYLPLCLVLRRDRVLRTLTHRVETPLFPCYLFVRTPRRDIWRPIRETPGVHSVLNSGNRILYASDASVTAVRAAEVLGRTTPTDPAPAWRPGMPCALAYGAFQGLPAVVLEVSREAAHIGVMFLGTVRDLQVPIEALARRDP